MPTFAAPDLVTYTEAEAKAETAGTAGTAGIQYVFDDPELDSNESSAVTEPTAMIDMSTSAAPDLVTYTENPVVSELTQSSLIERPPTAQTSATAASSMAPVHAFSDLHAPGIGGGRTFHEHDPSLCDLLCPCISTMCSCKLSPTRTLTLEEQTGRIMLQTKQTGCCKYIVGADDMTTCVLAQNALSVTNAREGINWKEALAILHISVAISGVIVPILFMVLILWSLMVSIVFSVLAFGAITVGLFALNGWLKPSGLNIYVHDGLGVVFIPLKKTVCIEARDAVLNMIDAAKCAPV